MRTVSFCFDDGFRATAGKVWLAFAARDLAASFCVLAAPDLTRDPFIRAAQVGDWGFWREARAAGHEVAPHGWAHEHLGQVPFDEARAGLERTLEDFTRELPGFEATGSLFHLAYLAAPEPVVDFIGGRTLGVRRALGQAGLNPAGSLKRGGGVDCITFGDGADALAMARVERFLKGEDGWLVLVFHGLDGEGWGTLASATLEALLDRLGEAGVRIAPANQVMLEQL
jgi:peptidoglycan/xylan/chitin deacetylase (PgdA/CDA1 family)